MPSSAFEVEVKDKAIEDFKGSIHYFSGLVVWWSGGWSGGWTLKVENKTISASIELKLKLS